MKQRRLLPLAFLFLFTGAMAQDRLPSRYSYSPLSQRFISDAMLDSIVHATVYDLLEQRGVPTKLADRKYPVIKELVVGMSRSEVNPAFKRIDNSVPKKLSAADMDRLRIEYVDAFSEAIRKTFAKNSSLSLYLNYGGSDRITNFQSIVTVLPNGKLRVQENISIHNGNGEMSPMYSSDGDMDGGEVNNEIKRGIVRAFPLYYVNKYKLFQNTTFDLKQVLRDGKPEDYHTEYHENGILVYTGSRDVILPEGNYAYTIIYETDHQLKLLDSLDELYWNVTGNGWSFRIDSASCKIILPKNAGVIRSSCYTGLQGSKEKDCNYTVIKNTDSTILLFRVTHSFAPWQGLTVATSWQKGLILASGPGLGYYIWNNKAVFFLPIAALFSLLFCFIYWRKYGRDPERGTIYPQYEPPAGYSPAATGYIYKQGFKNNLVAAAVVDAAVRNIVKIDVSRSGFLIKHNEYYIRKSDKAIVAADGGYEDFNEEITNLRGTVIKRNHYNSGLGSLTKKVREYCEKTYKNKDGVRARGAKGLFSLNGSFTIVPVLVVIIAAVWGFFGGLIIALTQKNVWQLGYFAVGLTLCIVILKIFSRLLPAYSAKGREIMDKIEGFRMFLSTADVPRLDLLNPPKKSIELYEKYLPYAIALSCEVEWGKQFEEIIQTANIDGSIASASFAQSFAHDQQNFSSSFASSFSGAISSASTPPSSSSSSGSSGGGSSGGGGGGGGGGGW